jgi:hypothetical protein
MNKIIWAALAAIGCGALAAADVEAEPLHARARPSAEALATLAREGPAPQSSSQRFVPDRAAEAPKGDAKSPPPKKAEWATAPDATGVRITDPRCTAKRIREWYRVECADGYVSLLGGNREGIDLGAREEPYGAWFIFPARVGDARAAEFLFRAKWSIAPDVIVSEQWLEGDPAPLITVIGIAG